jgi:hypothetical protein
MTKPKVAKPKSELLDPRQALFLARYLNPNSKTYSNIYQSALDAGYSDSYALNMRAKSLEWVSENVAEVTKQELVTKAKKVLNKSLDSVDERLAQDTAKFVAKTDIEFSEKQEHTIVFPKPLLGGESIDA